MTRACTMCGGPATILDTEYDEAYCEHHAVVYDIFSGPHRLLSPPVAP